VALQLALVALVPACGAPGLPPAGPGPGEVEVGYGTQQEDDVTGAVTSVRSGETADVPTLRVEELLRGRVSGLQISYGASGQLVLRIRGTNSLLLDQEPLFVIDGIQIAPSHVQAAVAGLLPRDIRQIDVLKDIASTAIYGSRGAGGVIIITTRR
jgi:TonB-dependent SusC/RagA subfamily outer membrane receptor